MPGLQQGIGKRVEKRHITLGGREWLQQRRSLRSCSIAQLGFGIEQSYAALLRRQCIGARQQFQGVGWRARSARKLRGTQKRPGSQRVFPQLRGDFRHFHLPRELFRVQLRGALPAEQRVFPAPGFREHLRSLGVLLDGFFPAILLLQQKGVAGDAFRGLNRQRVAKETVVNRQRLGFVLGVDQQVEQVAVVDGSAVRLLQPRVKIAKRLRGLQVLRRAIQHGRPLQLFADVCGHQGFALGFLPWVSCKVRSPPQGAL